MRSAVPSPSWPRSGCYLAGWSGSRGRTLRGYCLYLAVDTDTGQVITYLLTHGRTRDAQMLAVLARRVRRVLGRRPAGVVADCGFTSRAALGALAATRAPFILGFARTRPIRARLATLSGHERRWLHDGGIINVGACPWDTRLRLIVLAARTPTSAGPGRRTWPGATAAAGA